MFRTDEMWKERRTFSRAEAWLDLRLMASHVPASVMMGGCVQHLDAGEVAVTERFLATRWGWSSKRVRVYLAYLQGRGMVVRRQGARATVLGITEEAVKGAVTDAVNPDDNQEVAEIEGAVTDAVKGARTRIYRNNILISIPARARTREEDPRQRIETELAEMAANQSWCEILCMAFHVSMETLREDMRSWADNCILGDVRHKDVDDAKAHFRNWLRTQYNNNGNKGSEGRTAADYAAEAQQRTIEEIARFIEETDRRSAGV